MKWLARLCAAVAIFVFWKAGLPFWMIACVVLLLILLISDFLMQAAFNQALNEMGSDKVQNDEIKNFINSLAMDAIPNWLSAINMIASFASFILLVVSLVIYF